MVKFVYRRVNGKVFCEKHYYDKINSATGKPHDLGIIFEKILTDKEKDMSLDELKLTYPYNLMTYGNQNK